MKNLKSIQKALMAIAAIFILNFAYGSTHTSISDGQIEFGDPQNNGSIYTNSDSIMDGMAQDIFILA